ncbi:MAG TPA: hypothetical protein VFA10_27560 [Ktedonobacteraceae bacterium]|nr:hypothetical protein [Ktedonobacteraceae bacterium]
MLNLEQQYDHLSLALLSSISQEAYRRTRLNPGIREVGVQPAHADVAQEKMLLVPGLTHKKGQQ